MTVDCPNLPPLTKPRIRQAIEDKQVMDSRQAAEWLDVSLSTVRTWVAKKWLRTILPGVKPLLFLEEEVYHYEDFRTGKCDCARKMTRA